MVNKINDAANKRISQINEELEVFINSPEQVRAYEGGYFDREVSLDKIESTFEKYFNEINELIEKYALDKDFSENFKAHFTVIIYNEAIKRKDFLWAIKFAEKNKIE